MHGTRQQLVIALAVVATAVITHSAPALAYHNGQLFDRAPGGGGGGGLFYTGSKRDRGWDCTACHIDAPREVKINVTSQPPGLLDDRAYIPGQAYTISIALADPSRQLGVAATRSNFNSIAVSFLDPDAAPVGTISGFDPTKYYARGNAILATDTTTVNETSWTFTWTAPASGDVALDLGVVDGNGADSTGTSTLTDPLGDDVAMLHLQLSATGARLGYAPRSLQRSERAHASWTRSRPHRPPVRSSSQSAWVRINARRSGLRRPARSRTRVRPRNRYA